MKKKPTKPEEEDKSKKVEPQSIQEKLQDGSCEALKLAGQARTDSITLAGLDYADDLSQALLKTANETEEFYRKVQSALKKKASDKDLKPYVPLLENKVQLLKKMKAGQVHDSWSSMSPQVPPSRVQVFISFRNTL